MLSQGGTSKNLYTKNSLHYFHMVRNKWFSGSGNPHFRNRSGHQLAHNGTLISNNCKNVTPVINLNREQYGLLVLLHVIEKFVDLLSTEKSCGLSLGKLIALQNVTTSYIFSMTKRTQICQRNLQGRAWIYNLFSLIWVMHLIISTENLCKPTLENLATLQNSSTPSSLFHDNMIVLTNVLGEKFNSSICIKQGCVLALVLINLFSSNYKDLILSIYIKYCLDVVQQRMGEKSLMDNKDSFKRNLKLSILFILNTLWLTDQSRASYDLRWKPTFKPTSRFITRWAKKDEGRNLFLCQQLILLAPPPSVFVHLILA